MMAKTTTKAPQMVRTRIDLDMETRQEMVGLLNQHLADTFDLMSQSKQAHWNVKGPEFFQLHELYDVFAEGLSGHVDTIAERATALGGVATGTARMAAASTRLPEFPAEPVDGIQSVELLAERFAKLAKATREAIDTAEQAEDMGTSDMFTAIVQDLDKWLWFLEAHVQK